MMESMYKPAEIEKIIIHCFRYLAGTMANVGFSFIDSAHPV